MLHPGQALRSLHGTAQTLIVELVRNRTRRPPVEHGSHGDYLVLLRDILMNGVVCESRKREASTREKHLNRLGRRALFHAIENVAGLLSR
jgi:hypothetical protein